MAHLSISNIGPIKNIDIELNQFNVFIGPQSSGKSTIAKIISFCQWLEKDCIVRQQSSHINKTFIRERFIDYHNISSYINDDSSFVYSGNVLTISYAGGNVEITTKKEITDVQVSKNAYIPSERNVIAIPGIFSTKMPDNYVSSFLDDWQQIRSKFGREAKVDILNLGESYFYDDTRNTDMLEMHNGKPFPLSQASSGLQSVTPLCVYIAYITEWIYSHVEDKSSDERKRIWDSAVAKTLYDQNRHEEGKALSLDIIYDERKTTGQLRDSFRKLSDMLQNANITGDDEVDSILKTIKGISDSLGKPVFSNIVIEEPELNLFPATQADLMYYILSKVDHTRDNMVITTHSPYILYAVNNCILANIVKGNVEVEDRSDVDVPESVWVDGKKISVWELRDGYIKNQEKELNLTIQDNDGLIRGNYFDRVMHNIMADFNNLMNYK